MQPEGPRRAETNEWLAKARDDLGVVDTLLKASPPHVAAALFHCQQASEKCLKALLTWHEVPFTKTHDLEQLAASCLSVEPGLQGVVEGVEDLTPFAWRFRYPGAPADPEMSEAIRAYQLASSLFDRIWAALEP